MKPVPFRQYLRPDGRQKDIEISRPDDIHGLAEKVLESGRYRFEAEVLMTGQVSVTCFDTKDEVDIAIEICANGPDVPDRVDTLIRDSARIVGVAADG